MLIPLLVATGLAAHFILHFQILSKLEFSLNWLLLFDFAGILLGYYLADFFTSLAHWLGDCPERWHSRYLGAYRKLAQKHHKTPLAILHENFWQIRGNIAWLYSPPLLLALYLTDYRITEPIVFALIAFSNGLFISHTLHKILHSARQPWPIRMLQSLRLIISRDYHLHHHIPPYNKNFAALNGWADHLFNWLILRDNHDSPK